MAALLFCHPYIYLFPWYLSFVNIDCWIYLHVDIKVRSIGRQYGDTISNVRYHQHQAREILSPLFSWLRINCQRAGATLVLSKQGRANVKCCSMGDKPQSLPCAYPSHPVTYLSCHYLPKQNNAVNTNQTAETKGSFHIQLGWFWWIRSILYYLMFSLWN